jgi:signal transduction histidine kinase
MKFFSLLAASSVVAMAFQATPALAQTATLEQAKDLVHRGRAALRKDGCRKTFDEITNGTAFRDPAHKELYLYVYDEKLNNLAHGGNPKLVGKNLWDMKDMKGRAMNQELLKVAKRGGGEVEFDFLNPATGKVDPKVGWAEIEDKTDCGPVMIGSGVYRPRSK